MKMQQRWLVILVGVLLFVAGLLMLAMHCKRQRKMRHRRVAVPASKQVVRVPQAFPFDETIYELVEQPALIETKLQKYLPTVQHHMVVVIPSYKNAQWYERNLASVFEQTYKNYSVIYIDDASPDKTGDLVEAYVKKMGKQESVRVIKNAINKGAMANIYAAIHSVDASAIIVTLDGDDFFAKSSVLELINKVYNKYDVVLTYGSYQEYAYKGEPGHNCQQVPKDIIDQRAYRCMEFFSLSQLRTFKAGLFQAIAKEDLMYEGTFFDAAYDVAMMYPMAEMAGNRHMYIPDVLYLYNTLTPLNDHKLRYKRQRHCTRVIKKRPMYPLRNDIR